MRDHRHRSETTRETVFDYCPCPDSCDPAAHGGLARWERCACGAVRHTLVNGAHRERGPWVRVDPVADR